MDNMHDSLRKVQIQLQLRKQQCNSRGTDLTFLSLDMETNKYVQVHAHKYLLSSLSPLLNELFETAQLKQPYENVTITLDLFDSEIVKKLIEYIYEGNIMVNSLEKDKLRLLCRVLGLELPLSDELTMYDGICNPLHECEVDTQGISNPLHECEVDSQELYGNESIEVTSYSQSIPYEDDIETSPYSGVFMANSDISCQILKYESEQNSDPMEDQSFPKFKAEHDVIQTEKTENEAMGINPEKCHQYCVYYSKQDGHFVSGSRIGLCNECGFKTSNRMTLTKHMNVTHNMYKMFKCSYDDYFTSSRHSFQLHMNSQHFKIRYKCDKCNLSTSSLQYLSQHKKSVHSNINKEYTCNLCEYIGKTKECLTTHLKTHISRNEFSFINNHE